MKFFLTILLSSISFAFLTQTTLITIPEAGTNDPNYIDICACDTVTFQLQGNLENVSGIMWQLDDGSFLLGDEISSYQFCDPGLHQVHVIYIVNGNETIEESSFIRVATAPHFSELLDMDYFTCQGQSIDFIGGFVDENNFSGFEMSPSSMAQATLTNEAINGNIPDAGPPCFVDTLSFVFDDQIIVSADQVSALSIKMNHTYMGDLVITYTCPNGSSVTTHLQGGGTTNLGNDSLGYNYSWTNSQDLPTWVGAAPDYGTLPAGSYQSLESFDNFVGCPINGDWSIEVCDMLSADLGAVFSWGIDLNVFDTTTYTPTPINAYWETNESIIAESTSGITILQQEPYDTYTFVVEDNFGCSYSQEVSLTVNEPIDLELENQVDLFCTAQQFSIESAAANNCSQNNGSYDYCYGNDEVQNWLYCPDEVGSGTMMTVTFLGGYLEVNYDYIYIYDGDSPDAPLIATLNGAIENMSYTATNESGCILVQLITDYSVNCSTNNYDPINYSVSCGDANNYSWSWEPANLLTDPNSPLLQINEITGDNMVLTATITDPNNPGCELIHDVVVFTGNMFDVGLDNQVDVCITEQGLSLYNFLNGTPSGEGIWLNENNEQVSGFFTPQELGVFNFYYTSENCQASSLVEVTVSSTPEVPSIIVDGEFLITGIYSNYQWYLDGVLLEGATNQSYTAPVDGNYTVEVFNDAGCSILSNEVFVGEENTDNINEYQQLRFSILPNPFHEKTRITFANKLREYEVSMYSITGNVVRKYSQVKNELIIDKDDLEAGIYIIQVEDASGISRKHRLVIR